MNNIAEELSQLRNESVNARRREKAMKSIGAYDAKIAAESEFRKYLDSEEWTNTLKQIVTNVGNLLDIQSSLGNELLGIFVGISEIPEELERRELFKTESDYHSLTVNLVKGILKSEYSILISGNASWSNTKKGFMLLDVLRNWFDRYQFYVKDLCGTSFMAALR